VPDKDIAVEYTGLKTGEKLTEILSSSEESLDATAHEKLLLVRNTGLGTATLDEIDEFVKTVRQLSNEEVKEGIRRIVPDYKIGGVD
jgi:FlaA1/EpsC-like NDP-sugar epimerase